MKLKTKIAATALAVSLASLSTGSMAAANNPNAGGGGGLLNSGIFADLYAQVEANSLAIAENTAAIELLNSQVAEINTQLSGMTSQILANESSISQALDLLASNSQDIVALRSDLYNLKLQVNTDIDVINQQLDLTRAQINELTINMTALATYVSQTSAQLQAAIEQNSSDIATLTANLVMLNSSLSLLQTSVTSLQVQVDNADNLLTDQQGSIDSLNIALGDLEIQVANINTGTTTAGGSDGSTSTGATASFTLTDTTDAADDFSQSDLVNGINSLGLQSGSYVYARGNGVAGTYEICTNSKIASDVMGAFVNGATLHSTISATGSNESWVKFGDTAWMNGNIDMTSYYNGTLGYLKISASMYIFPDGWGSVSSELMVGNMWTTSTEQSVTVRSAGTRQDACGF